MWLVTPERKNEALVGEGSWPVFSRDGLSIAAADSEVTTRIQRFWFDRSHPVQTLLEKIAWPTDWSSDGRWLVVQHPEGATQFDISVLDLRNGGPLRAIVQTRGNDWQGRLSPNQKWIAYASDVSGRAEVYIRPFEGPGESMLVSSGGNQPQWREDGRELFYLSEDRSVMAVSVEPRGDRLDVGLPEPLFSLPIGPQGNGQFVSVFVPIARGSKFLVARRVDDDRRRDIVVLVNWPDAIARGGRGNER